MKTSHINHVVLYAKNFYRHTNDFIGDMQRFMQLDGHPYNTINTAEKVLNVMRADYIQWVESLPDNFHQLDDPKNYFLKDLDKTVWWASGEAAYIWIYLGIYSIYIPITAEQLGYPKYDQYHLPQFNFKEQLFNKNMSYDEMNKAAKKFLDKTQVERFDAYMNKLMDQYHFNELAEIYTKLGDKISSEDLENEMWDEYTKFIDEKSIGNEGKLIPGNHHRYTKHFDLTFKTDNDSVNIEAYATFGKMSSKIYGEFNGETLSLLFDDAVKNRTFAKSFVNSGKTINEVFTKNGFDDETINEKWLTIDGVENFISSTESSFRNNFAYDELTKFKQYCIFCGHAKYNVTINEDYSELTITIVNLWKCSCMDEQLFNEDSLMPGAKY